MSRQVNTKTYRGKSKILVGIGILTSYERMGTALLACESGCQCEARLLDGHTEEKASQTEWVYHSGARAAVESAATSCTAIPPLRKFV